MCVGQWVESIQAQGSVEQKGGFVNQLGQTYSEGGIKCLNAYIKPNSVDILSPQGYKKEMLMICSPLKTQRNVCVYINIFVLN